MSAPATSPDSRYMLGWYMLFVWVLEMRSQATTSITSTLSTEPLSKPSPFFIISFNFEVITYLHNFFLPFPSSKSYHRPFHALFHIHSLFFPLIVYLHIYICICVYIPKYNHLNLYVTFMFIFRANHLKLDKQLVCFFLKNTISPTLSLLKI